MAHSHELFYRTKNQDGTVTLSPFAKQQRGATEPGEDLMKLIDGLAADGKSLTQERDAIIYKIDGKCEYMISRDFFLYPNTGIGKYDNPNFSKGQSRRNGNESRNPRSFRQPQS